MKDGFGIHPGMRLTRFALREEWLAMLILSPYTVVEENEHRGALVIPNIVSKPREVDVALHEIGLTPEIVREVAIAAASARAEALPIDPCSAPGTKAYHEGVRQTRLKLLPLGWRISRVGNVEATVNDDLGVQILFQNVDRACTAVDPCAISGKGPTARQLINCGQGDLFDSPRRSSKPSKLGNAPVVWLICVSSDDDSVQAEVSCPLEFEGDQFSGFSPRIFVVNDLLEAQPIRRGNEKDLDPGFDIDVQVTKK